MTMLGSSNGLEAANTVKIWHEDSPGIDTCASEPGDQFGYSVTAGDFNNDGIDDLAIGVTKEAIGDKSEAGAVNVLYEM